MCFFDGMFDSDNNCKWSVVMRMVITLILLAEATCVSSGAERLANQPLLTDSYPRAFYFRQSEGLATHTQLPYQDWQERFLGLDGIMGKCLDEEIPNRSLRNIDFFTRYKQDNPSKTVMLHFNGNARDPHYQTDNYFAGHWLYLNGCRLTEDLPEESGVSTVKVKDPSLFRMNMGRFGDKNEDLGLCILDEKGRPDWSRSEQVQLLGVDKKAKAITIQRGAFGTAPRAFPKGQGYAAAHMLRGPWGKKSNLLWRYNYATTCPRNAAGETCADVLLEDLTGWFSADGPLAAFDGIEFDVLNFQPLGGGRNRGADVDADGIADAGMVDGVSAYGLGVHQFIKRLRAALGAGRLITADGHGLNNQRSTSLLNGIESEGWPALNDPTLSRWSGGLNRHFFWRDRAQQPTLNYINHRFLEKGNPIEVPHGINRLVMAAAHFTDSAFTYPKVWPLEKGFSTGIWDELHGGQAAQPRWLGKALGPARHLGFDTPDLLANEGVIMSPAFLRRWQSEDGEIRKTGAEICITGADSRQSNVTAYFSGISVPDKDLLVRFSIHAKPLDGYPAEIPRLVRLSCAPSGRMIRPQMPEIFSLRRDAAEKVVSPEGDGVLFRYFEDRTINGEIREAYLAHPPLGRDQKSGTTIWQRKTILPEKTCSLSFYTGLSAAPNPSDGVVFRVEIETNDGTKTLFENHQTEVSWISRNVDLSPWAGQAVTLRFATDCGPHDNVTADHALWGDVYVSEADTMSRPTGAKRKLMTWADGKPFEAVFYFRDVGPATVDIQVEIEGGAPVYLTDLHAYSAADTLARAYEGGLVIANPSNRAQPFNLEKLYPGTTLRRLKGTANQDPTTNNGEAVGAQLVLPPMDALFLAVK
jgi:hypothetical protein